MFKPQANSTAWGLRTRPTAAISRPSSLPVEHANQREQPARGIKIKVELLFQSLQEQVGALVVERPSAHVDRLNLTGRSGADSAVIAFTDQKVILHDASKWGQRQKMRDDRGVVLEADVEDQAILGDAQIQPIRTALMPVRGRRLDRNDRSTPHPG